MYNACCPSWPLALKFLINKFGDRVYECWAGLELCILAQAGFGLIATLPSPAPGCGAGITVLLTTSSFL